MLDNSDLDDDSSGIDFVEDLYVQSKLHPAFQGDLAHLIPDGERAENAFNDIAQRVTFARGDLAQGLSQQKAEILASKKHPS